MRRCELCKAKARMHCASDQASLCWDCDAAVHSANFLVARHSRNLLCGVCQSTMSWSATGGKLRPNVSLCEHCVDQKRCDNSSDEESEAEEGEMVEDNQIVPWSPPPAAESSSSDDESVSGGDHGVSKKRFRIEADQICAKSRLNVRASPPYAGKDVMETFSRSKTAPHHKSQMIESGRVEVCGSGILDSLRRLHREDTVSDREMVELYASP